MSEQDGPRNIEDARTLRAVAHPLRVTILELLYLEGELTATQCGDRLGESAANCSFHLRQLAKHGFIEEAESGTGRQRPWRLAHIGMTWDSGTDQAPEALHAGRALGEVWRGRYRHHLAEWQAHRDEFGADWNQAATVLQYALPLTTAELEEINAAIRDLLDSYKDRLTEPSLRPDDARWVWFWSENFPIQGVPRPDETEREPDA